MDCMPQRLGSNVQLSFDDDLLAREIDRYSRHTRHSLERRLEPRGTALTPVSDFPQVDREWWVDG